ncbi:MAG: hypothetical protein FWF11_03625 [Coriobacteriia bacterium]|nr:hypothetical protein [Coriobacteriia bacterium]
MKRPKQFLLAMTVLIVVVACLLPLNAVAFDSGLTNGLNDRADGKGRFSFFNPISTHLSRFFETFDFFIVRPAAAEDEPSVNDTPPPLHHPPVVQHQVTGASIAAIAGDQAPVTEPVAGQILVAHIETTAGRVNGYPANEDALFQWFYAEDPATIVGTESTYALTGDDVGQVLAVTVSMKDKTGSATWTASQAVQILVDLNNLLIVDSAKIYGEDDALAYPPLDRQLLAGWCLWADPADFDVELWRQDGEEAGSYTVYAQASSEAENYRIIPLDSEEDTIIGSFEILPRPLTVTAANASQAFNGVALTRDLWFLTAGTLLDGHELQVTVTGSQLAVGFSPNVPSAATITYVAADDSEVDVTANYDISYVNGTLTVSTPPPQTAGPQAPPPPQQPANNAPQRTDSNRPRPVAETTEEEAEEEAEDDAEEELSPTPRTAEAIEDAALSPEGFDQLDLAEEDDDLMATGLVIAAICTVLAAAIGAAAIFYHKKKGLG